MDTDNENNALREALMPQLSPACHSESGSHNETPSSSFLRRPGSSRGLPRRVVGKVARVSFSWAFPGSFPAPSLLRQRSRFSHLHHFTCATNGQIFLAADPRDFRPLQRNASFCPRFHAMASSENQLPNRKTLCNDSYGMRFLAADLQDVRPLERNV